MVILLCPIACSLTCQNGGTLSRNSCTCSCADGYSGTSCESELRIYNSLGPPIRYVPWYRNPWICLYMQLYHTLMVTEEGRTPLKQFKICDYKVVQVYILFVRVDRRTSP